MTEGPQSRLRALLLERPEYTEAYLNSAEFKHSVESIIRLLPLILAQAYADALEHERVRKEAIKQSWWEGFQPATLDYAHTLRKKSPL